MSEPARILFSDQTDANGKASTKVKAPPTLFGVLTVVAQCAGNPNWTVTSGSVLLGFGNGPQVNIGPILTIPGETLTVSITNGAPNAQVTGTAAGTQHQTADEAADHFHPAPNVLTISSFGTQELLGSLTAVNGTVSRSFTPSRGTRALKFGWHAGTATAGTKFTVVGDQSGISYGGSTQATPVDNLTPITLSSPWVTLFDLAFDTSFTVTLTDTAPGFVLEVGASPDVEIVTVSTIQNGFVSLTDALSQAAISVDNQNNQTSLDVSLVQAHPAPWQAATNSAPLTGGIGATSAVTFIPAPGAGLSIYLHFLSFIPGTANTFGKFQPHGGVSLYEWACVIAGQPIFHDFRGLKLAANTAFDVTNDATVGLTSEGGGLSYSIGP